MTTNALSEPKLMMDVSRVASATCTLPQHLPAAAKAAPTLPPRQLLKTAAQELNHPIAAIKTALTLLNASSLKPQQRQQYLAMIGQACDRQNNLIEALFELLELQLLPQKQTPEPLQLWNLVPAVVSTYQPLAQEKSILLAYTVARDLPPIFAVESYLKQALVNLLVNSIQCVGDNGRIWVKAHPHGTDQVALVIQDNGRGIDPAVLPRVFDPFYRHLSDGNGLGLALVQQWLALCGASVTVGSPPREGTAFTVLLSVVPT